MSDNQLMSLINFHSEAATTPAPELPTPAPDLLRMRRDAQRRFDATGLPRLTSLKVAAA